MSLETVHDGCVLSECWKHFYVCFQTKMDIVTSCELSAMPFTLLKAWSHRGGHVFGVHLHRLDRSCNVISGLSEVFHVVQHVVFMFFSRWGGSA